MVDSELNVAEAEWLDEDGFEPRYNIAPRSNAPVIRRRAPDNGELVIQTMKWGLIPHWSKHEDVKLNTINARAENLIEPAGMWSSMKAKKRCVVVCDGYFEWLKKGKERLPHFIRRKDKKITIMAGLYDSVVLEGTTDELWTFSVVTTDASQALSWLHDRQPVILSSTEQLKAWLDTSKGWHSSLIGILKSGDGGNLECYPVRKEVGRVGTNSPEFIKPISQRKDGIETMFTKKAMKRTTASSDSQKPHNSRNPKCAMKIETSPPSSSSCLEPPNKKQKLSQTPTGKRTMSGGPEGTPTNKRSKNGEFTREDEFLQNPAFTGQSSHGRISHSQSTPSPRQKTIAKNAKITSFFQPKG